MLPAREPERLPWAPLMCRPRGAARSGLQPERAGLFRPTSPGELSRARSGYDRARTSPHTCFRPEHPFYGADDTPFPWFGRECRHIHFSRAPLGGVRRAYPPRSSRPSSLLRKERARCSESNAAIDESKRALTSSPMRPVRPGGTSTTDSSCPSAHPPRIIEWDRASATPAYAHCGWTSTPRVTPSSAATRPTSSPKSSPDDGRSIRPPGTPLTYPRRQTCSTEVPEALYSPSLLVGPRR